jgi:hypothetical protein
MWLFINWLPGGQIWFPAMLNSSVHVVMYLYYALALIPSMRNKLWWKRYITRMQLTQFVCVIVHSAVGYLSGCGYPFWGLTIFFYYAILMLFLFGHFYRQEYKMKSKLN